MNGDLDSGTLNDFTELIDTYSNIDKIEIIEVSGFKEDEINEYGIER